MIFIPDMEMLTQIRCLCLPWDRAATAIPWSKKTKQMLFRSRKCNHSVHLKHMGIQQQYQKLKNVNLIPTEVSTKMIYL